MVNQSMHSAAGPTDARPPFRFSAFMRVGFDETDAQAVVYYGRYFPYFDRARVEYARHLGIFTPSSRRRQFVMRNASCEYEAPARFDDLLEVFIRVAAIGRSSVRWQMQVYHAEQDQLLARAEETMVLIDVHDRRPTPVPDRFRRAVGAFESPR